MISGALTSTIITYISTLGPIELIENIGAGKFLGDALKYAYEKLKQKQLEGKYLFTPKPSELEELKNIENSDLYLRTEQLLGFSPLFGILRLGIFINHLKEQEGRESKILEVRERVFKKYGDGGIRVLNLASTGELSYVLKDLNIYYQNKRCDKLELCRLFEYILKRWKEITIFVKSENSQEDIERMIKLKIGEDYPYFFVFSYGSASKDAYLIVAKLTVSNFFFEKKYLPQLRHHKKNEDYAWVFENLEKDILDFN